MHSKLMGAILSIGSHLHKRIRDLFFSCQTHNKMYHILGTSFEGQPQSYPRRLVYCCYTHGFPSVSGFTDDVGWGCTIRSFQMLLGNTLDKTGIWDKSLFILDDGKAPFSFQSIAKRGIKYAREVGEWFKPSETAKCIKDIFEANNGKLKGKTGFDFFIYGRDDVDDVTFPALMVFPTKLGVDTIDRSHFKNVLDILKHPNTMGIVGGSGSSSYYLIGTTHDDKILYLDPHDVRDWKETKFDHKKICVGSLDTFNPSVAFAFLLPDSASLTSLKQQYPSLLDIADPEETSNLKYSCVDMDEFCVILEDEEEEEAETVTL